MIQITMEVSVDDNELSMQYINEKNYICPSLLEKILSDVYVTNKCVCKDVIKIGLFIKKKNTVK